MTTKKYKTHEELGITFREHLAIMGVLTAAKRGVFAPSQPCTNTFQAIHGAHVLDMGTSLHTHACGTVGCIGGHVALLLGERGSTYVMRHDIRRMHDQAAMAPLVLLYFPSVWRKGHWVRRSGSEWGHISLSAIVKAIENFLTGARNPWDGVKMS